MGYRNEINQQVIFNYVVDPRF